MRGKWFELNENNNNTYRKWPFRDHPEVGPCFAFARVLELVHPFSVDQNGANGGVTSLCVAGQAVIEAVFPETLGCECRLVCPHVFRSAKTTNNLSTGLALTEAGVRLAAGEVIMVNRVQLDTNFPLNPSEAS